jgi:hypothetical protein
MLKYAVSFLVAISAIAVSLPGFRGIFNEHYNAGRCRVVHKTLPRVIPGDQDMFGNAGYTLLAQVNGFDVWHVVGIGDRKSFFSRCDRE